MDFDPNLWYEFRDENGNTEWHKGDNDFVEQAYTEGVPITLDENGDWHTSPWVTSDGGQTTVHVPDWFTKTDAWQEYQDNYAYLVTNNMSQELIDNTNTFFNNLGASAAFEYQQKKNAANAGLDENYQKQYWSDIVKQIGNQHAGAIEDAIISLPGQETQSVEEILEPFRQASTEDLSNWVQANSQVISDAVNGKETDQDRIYHALAMDFITNYVDNYAGDVEKWQPYTGLLQASAPQKFQSALAAFNSNIASSPLAWPFRIVAGFFDPDEDYNPAYIDEMTENELYTSTTGFGLEGREGSITAGGISGSLANFAAMTALTVISGNMLSGAAAAGTLTGAAQTIAKASGNLLRIPLVGSGVADFVLQDAPMDAINFATNLARTGSLSEAWESSTEQQYLIPLPIPHDNGEGVMTFGIGPKVGSGLKNDLIGDAILDLIPVAFTLTGVSIRKLDDVTNGGITRIRNTVSTQGVMRPIRAFADNTAPGHLAKRFFNAIRGPEAMERVRLGMRAAVVSNSVDPYIVAQNINTFVNHHGATVIAPMYKKIANGLGIPDAIKYFQKNASKYGGFSQSKKSWLNAWGKKRTKVMNDQLPAMVKDGLNDIEMLGYLKGVAENEGELIKNSSRDKLINELQAKVDELPDEIKEFAGKWSQLNKEVEKMGVSLGITKQSWIDALKKDPRWDNYMVRQMLQPGEFSPGGIGADPTDASILTKGRVLESGDYIDPTLAMGIKLDAMGQAFAYNEAKKAVVAFEVLAGKKVVGLEGREAAQQLKEINAKISSGEKVRAQIGYDKVISDYQAESNAVAKEFTEVNKLINSGQRISMDSIYNASQSPAITHTVNDFETGKITFADGVVDAVGLDDSQASAIIQNTYSVKDGEMVNATDASMDYARINFSDVDYEQAGKNGEVMHNAGVNEKGEPFRYTVEDGKITSIEKIEDAEGVADSINKRGGTDAITVDTINQMGVDKAYGVNKTITFYQNNLPAIPYHPSYYMGYDTKGVLGWCPVPLGLNLSFVDGKIVADEFPTYQNILHYGNKVSVDEVVAQNKQMVTDGSSPKNSFSPEATAVHESGHSLMSQMAILRLNKKIEAGELELPPNPSGQRLKVLAQRERDDIQWEIIDTVMEEMGFKREDYSPAVYEHMVVQAANTISTYAASRLSRDYAGRTTFSEIFSEAMNEYYHNGESSSRFTLGVVNQVRARLAPYSVAANPAEVFKKNKVIAPKGLFNKEGGYNFPKSVKTDAQKARWLERWRQKNPYIKVTAGRGKKFGFATYKEVQKKVDDANLDLINDLEVRFGLTEKLEEIERLGQIKEYDGYVRGTDPLVDKLLDIFDSQKKNFIFVDGFLDEGVIDWSKVPKETQKEIYEEFVGLIGDTSFAAMQRQAVMPLLKDGNEAIEYVGPKKFYTADAYNGQLTFDSISTTKREVTPKATLTDEEYIAANKWDTFFAKEIEALGGKTKMPDALMDLDTKYLENKTAEMAKQLAAKIQEITGDFDVNLAHMLFNGNTRDAADALENWLVSRVNKRIDELTPQIAKEMGIDEAEARDIAAATVWSDDAVKRTEIDTLAALIPTAGMNDIQERVEATFRTQRDGYKASPLEIETGYLRVQQEQVAKKLSKSNAAAKKAEKTAAKTRRAQGYLGDETQLIHYKEGGEDVYVKVDDPLVAACLRRPNYKNTGFSSDAAVQAMNIIARTYRLGTTGINPLALIKNLLRDPLQAIVQGGYSPFICFGPQAFYHTLMAEGLELDTIKKVDGMLKNWAAGSSQTAEIRNAGVGNAAANTYITSGKVRKNPKKVEKLKNVISYLESPLEAWESTFRNSIAQQSFVKNYRRTGDINQAMGRAMFDASNSTTNFSHALGKYQSAVGTIPYLSAAINGVGSFWTQAIVDPIGMLIRVTAGFAVPVMAVTAWNLSDEERRKRYMDLPEWYRDSHIVLVAADNAVFSVPVPEELFPFFGTARRAIEYTHQVSPDSIGTIIAKGAFDFIPVDLGGFITNGEFTPDRGFAQLANGIMPQAATAIYEFIAEKDLFTGQDLSSYSDFQRGLNLATNIFGTGAKQIVNDLGTILQAPPEFRLGKNTIETLARDLFGTGFKDSINQFYQILGNERDVVNGKVIPATGLFAEREKLMTEIDQIDSDIFKAQTDQEKQRLEGEKQDKINAFTQEVGGMLNKYMQLYTLAGGLEDWQKNKLVQVLTLIEAPSTAEDDSYQDDTRTQAFLDEQGLALQRYMSTGLPSGQSKDSFIKGDKSIAMRAALNRFYGAPKQAVADFDNLYESSGVKEIRDKYSSQINAIYAKQDAGEKLTDADYDQIEKLQATYLQAFDSVMAPIIQKYGLSILNNNNFINEMRGYLSNMIPSDDWKESYKRSGRFMSSKEYPLAGPDVKKWLINRYASGMKERDFGSDDVVTEKLESIRGDIESGKMGSAQGKIKDLLRGVQKSEYYISAGDYQTLSDYASMIQ